MIFKFFVLNSAFISASSQEHGLASTPMIYQVLNDLCSQHIDTHHHFFVADSSTYVHLPKLLSFANNLYDSDSKWLGKYWILCQL